MGWSAGYTPVSLGDTVKRKKPAYGKRYSAEEKNDIVTAWRANLAAAAPQSKAAFCKHTGITSATLDAWLAATPPAPAVVAELVSPRLETRAMALPTDDVTTALIAAIRQRQAELATLKAQLHQIIDGL